MTYDLYLVGGLDVARLVAALAGVLAVPVEAVDVSAQDAPDRRWDAAVLCGFFPVSGDISFGLDVFVRDDVPALPPPATVAQRLADELTEPILYAATDGFPESAFWMAVPGDGRTRARVLDGDAPDELVMTIDAVERPVASLPSVRVAAQPEVIREHRMPTPVADGFRRGLAGEGAGIGDPLRRAGNDLAAWEGLAGRMAAGWPPDGWYPEDFYREDLDTRDRLAAAAGSLTGPVGGRFAAALTEVDDAFRAGTREIGEPAPRGWWWGRVPDPVPWLNEPGRAGPR